MLERITVPPLRSSRDLIHKMCLYIADKTGLLQAKLPFSLPMLIFYTWPNLYDESMFFSLVNAGARPIGMRTNYKLIGVNYAANDSVRLQFENRPEIVSDYVIITVPLGVLKSRMIKFDPPLSREKLDAFDRTGLF